MIFVWRSARPPAVAWVMRATTSSPKATWGLVRAPTAISRPVVRSRSEPTTVVVPMSNAAPKQRLVVSPASNAMISWSKSTTVRWCGTARIAAGSWRAAARSSLYSDTPK